MNTRNLLIVTGLILALFMVIGAIMPPIESPDAKYDGDLMLSVDCSSPYQVSLEWTKDGPMGGPVSGSDEVTKSGHYSFNLKGQNVSLTAHAQKIDPSNVEDELKLSIIGKNEFKESSTFYPGEEIGGTLTGAEDFAFKEAHD